MRCHVVASAIALGIAISAAADPLPPDAAADGTTRGVAPIRAPSALPEPHPSLTLYFFDVNRRLSHSFASLAAETNDIFREMGIDVAWRQGGLGTVYGSGDHRELPIIVLDELPGARANEPIMGLVMKGAQPAAVWIYLENIKRTLGMTPYLAPQGAAAAILGVAVGRVVAHEVVHALVPELGHTSDGLMRHALTRAALIGKVRPAHAACVEGVRGAFGLRAPSVPSLTLSMLPFPPTY